MTTAGHAMDVQRLHGQLQDWLQDLKSGSLGQRLQDQVLPCIKELVNGYTSMGQAAHNDCLVLALRLLRNAIAVEPSTPAALIATGIPALLAKFMHSLPGTLTLSAEAVSLSSNPIEVNAQEHTGPGSSSGGSTATTANVAAADERQGQHQTLLVATLSQLLANLANSGPEGADAVWSNFFPSSLLLLVRHPEGSVQVPATLALYACCRSSLQRARQLCGTEDALPPPGPFSTDGSSSCPSAGSSAVSAGADSSAQQQARAIWEALLHSLPRDDGSAAATGTSSAPSQEPPAGQPDPDPRPPQHPPANEWLPLLCSCVAVRQGLLWPLLDLLAEPPGQPLELAHALDAPEERAAEAVLGAAASGAASGSGVTHAPAAGRRHGWSGSMPLLLHVLAVEVAAMQAAAVGAPASCAAQAPLPQQGGGDAGAVAAAAAVAAPDRAACDAANAEPGLPAIRGGSSDLGHGPLAALRLVAQVAAAAADECAQLQAEGMPAAAAELPAAVTEAALEVLKALTQREDGGAALLQQRQPQEATVGTAVDDAASTTSNSTSNASGAAAAGDLVEALACGCGMVRTLLAMLAALRPPKQLRDHHSGGPSTPFFGDPDERQARPAAAAAGPSAPPPPMVPLELTQMACRFPGAQPYRGYRGDLVAVLANAVYRRRRVQDCMLALGGLEVVLGQTVLDEQAPMAREWALWAVRNMCEGNQEAQARIASLQLDTVLDTPEMQRLGMKLQVDGTSGKMKVVQTEEGKQKLLEAQQQRR